MLATRSQADVVTVTIRGSREILEPDSYHVRGGWVDVVIGQPIPSAGLSNTELAERVRQEITSNFYRQPEVAV